MIRSQTPRVVLSQIISNSIATAQSPAIADNLQTGNDWPLFTPSRSRRHGGKNTDSLRLRQLRGQPERNTRRPCYRATAWDVPLFFLNGYPIPMLQYDCHPTEPTHAAQMQNSTCEKCQRYIQPLALYQCANPVLVIIPRKFQLLGEPAASWAFWTVVDGGRELS